jgi:hypothetical protein
MSLADVHRVLHPGIVQYVFFSEADVNFSKIDHILGHKESLNKYKKMEMPP